MAELHLYDFDGTLFQSPMYPSWWGDKGGWWSSPVSLGPPCVPDKPSGGWWNEKTVASAKRSIADPNVWAIVCTGRGDGTFARYRVADLLKQKGLNFDEVFLKDGGDTAAFKKKVIEKLLVRHPVIEEVHIWEDRLNHLADFVKFVEKLGRKGVPHPVRDKQEPCVIPKDEVPELVADGLLPEAVLRRTATRFLREARRPTPESRQFQKDEKDRAKHVAGAKRAFKELLIQLQPFAEKAKAEFPKKDQLSLQRRGRLFSKLVKTAPAMLSYLDTWIGSEAQHEKAYSWRGAIIYQARDVLLYGKTLRDAQVEVEKQAFKGFQAITMAEAQGPLREVVPPSLREYLPNNIVVEVDDKGAIKKVTDRFENEHLTLGVKIAKMKKLVRDYNKIAKRVKRDFKNPDEIIRMSAIITAILMETGIRPGKAGNGKVVTQNGEEVFVETFGAITLGPQHVKFVRANFAKLEFVGKMTSVNTAELADAAIIKALDDYVQKALKSGSKFIFVTKKGVQFSYSDLQRYFRENFGELSPTDFRKLKATETVLAALRNEQAALYERIKGFAGTAKDDLKERIVEAIVDAFEAAIAKSQAALSHDSAQTTVRSYINPEVILRFLSTGRVDDNLESAILGGATTLKFDPETFVKASGGQRLASGGRTATALGDLLLELREDLADAGVRKTAHAVVRLANRWMKESAGTAADITDNLKFFAGGYKDFVAAINDGQAKRLSGDHIVVRKWANGPWVQLMNRGYKIAEGILSTRSIPAAKAKGLEMAYRLFANSSRMPKDVYAWWAKNQRHLDLILEAATKWPEKQEGSDELFTVGSFRVHNTVGATGAELEGLKKTIAAAEKMARKNPVPGFARVLYGDIHVVARLTKAHHAAWYYPGDDSLYLRRGSKTGMDEVQSLVHELGHRYWAKFSKPTQRAAWDTHHREVENNDVPREEVHIPTVGEPFPVGKVPGVKGDPIVVKDDGANLYFEGVSRGRPTTFSIPRYKAFVLLKEQLKRTRNFPTAYSSKNSEEHFCEALKLLAAGALPKEHEIPFKAIWQ
jgi:hypothetical protein